MEVRAKELSEDDSKRIALVNSSNINTFTKRRIALTIIHKEQFTQFQIKKIQNSNLNDKDKNFILNMADQQEDEDQSKIELGEQQHSDNESASVSSEGEKGERNFKMLSKPEDFDGNPIKARTWFQDFLYCAKVNRWSNTLKAKRFPAFLKGSARNWYRVSIMDTRIEFDFEEIRKQFEVVFLPQSTRRAIAHEIEVKRQHANEPVSNFIMDMRLLCKQYDKEMGEDEIIDKIRIRLLKSFYPNIAQVFLSSCVNVF